MKHDLLKRYVSLGHMNSLVLRPLPHLRVLLPALGISVWLGATAACAPADLVTVDCRLRILREGTNAVVCWQLPPDDGQELLLQSALSLSGPWSTMTNAAQPLTVRIDEGNGRFFRSVLAMPMGSADASQMAQRVRDFAFSSIPQLNPATEFDIRVMPVGGLWEALQIQVLDVRCLFSGQQFNQFACVLHAGKVRTLGLSSGGYGLMSGLTQSGSFYYTYSWGSGIHRSHLGKLRIVNEELKFWESGGFPDVDLFFSRRTDGEIAVVSGKFEGFNRWLEPKEYGRIDEADPAATRLIGLDGSVLATLMPTDP